MARGTTARHSANRMCVCVCEMRCGLDREQQVCGGIWLLGGAAAGGDAHSAIKTR